MLGARNNTYAYDNANKNTVIFSEIVIDLLYCHISHIIIKFYSIMIKDSPYTLKGIPL
jgi:hypothetical protein